MNLQTSEEKLAIAAEALRFIAMDGAAVRSLISAEAKPGDWEKVTHILVARAIKALRDIAD